MRRPDVPIRVRKRIVHVERGSDMEPVVAIRAPDKDRPDALLKAPHKHLAYSPFHNSKKLSGGVPPAPPGGYAAVGYL